MRGLEARAQAFFHVPVARERPWLLTRGLLLLLALDCVVSLVAHGGRYGVGGFNVAHFALLDALAPMPSPALYLGALFTAALLALAQVLSGTTRLGVALVAALYTYAWASSLLDAYQHHYLLSLLLAWLVFFPHGSLASLREETSPRPAPAYVALGLSLTIVYFYAALTKLEAGFRSGAALGRMLSSETLHAIEGALFALTREEALRWLALGALLVELVTVLAIVLALLQDSMKRRAWMVSTLGLAPIGFHLAASGLGFEIGWFSYYMLFIHVVLFAPARLLRALVAMLDTPRRALARGLALGLPSARPEALLLVTLALLTPLPLLGLDLPGLEAAACIFACLLLVHGYDASRRRRQRYARQTSISGLLAALVIRLALTHGELGGRQSEPLLAASTVRYDYYRFVGGDALRRGDPSTARVAYAKALRYAPDEEKRARTRARVRSLESRRVGRR